MREHKVENISKPFREIVVSNVKKMAQAKYYKLRLQGKSHEMAFAEVIQWVILQII